MPTGSSRWRSTTAAPAVAADFRFLSVEQVIALHATLLRRFGGSDIPSHRGEVDGVSAAVTAVVNSYYEEVFDLAAAYAVYLVMGHVFGDGNKRAASAAALTFLELNGIAVSARSKALCDLMIDVQTRAESNPRPQAAELIEEVAAWLRARGS